MHRENLDNWCERSILALVLGILVFAPLALGAVDAWAFLVVQGMTMAVMFFWALRLWISPKPKLLWPPLCWVVLAFAIYAVARYFTADIEYVARQEMIKVVLYAFLFFAIVNNLYRQEFSQIISFTLILLAMGISGYAACQYLTHSDHVWNYIALYPGRASGTYISPNDLAGFLEMLVPLAVAYILAGRINAVMRILLCYSALMMAAGLAVTFSRGGWAACAVGLLAVLGVLLFSPRHQLPAFLLLLMLLGGGTLFFTKYITKTVTYAHRADEVTNSGGIAHNMRSDLWVAAIQMWQDNFWWGAGPAHYNYRFPAYRSQGVQAQPDRAHNDYLNLLADWGTTGGLIALAGISVFSVGLWQTRRHVRRAEHDFKSGNSNRFAFFAGASAALLALAAHSVVDFNLHIPANAIVGVTLLAVLTSNLRFATEKFWFTVRLPLKISVTVVLAGGIFYLGAQEIRYGRETLLLAQAEQLPVFSPERAAALEKAFAAEPENFQTAYAIGECYRMQGWDGGQNYEALLKTAQDWYVRTWKLDRYDAYSPLRYGMCLDKLDRADESGPYFDRATALDPNNYFITANIGWHYVQTGDYAAARPWLQRSLRLEPHGNPIAQSYLALVEKRLIENASGKNKLPSGF